MKAHPKIQNIVEAISNNQISVALKDINSLLSKDKARDKLPPETLETLKLLRGLCSVRTEQFGDAKKIFFDFIEANAKNTNVDVDLQNWMNYLGSTLGYYSELQKFSEPLQPKKVPDEKTAVNQMAQIVKAYDFKGAQSAALKVYKDFKHPKYMFSSILFQYLSIVRAPEPPQDIVKALELCCMFITKLRDDLKITDQAKALENLLNRQVIKLYAEILHKQKKREPLVKLLMEFPKVYEDDFEKYFNYLINLYREEASDSVKQVILTRYAEIFQQNNNLDTFRLWYNVYKQCITLLLTYIPKDKVVGEANLAVHSAQQLGEGEGTTYQFTVDASFEKLLGIFWRSLGNSYKIFEDSFKEHQHYRNAVKTVLTSKLEILRQIAFTKIREGKSIEGTLLEEYVEVLKSYTRHFIKIFTFPDEIYPFLSFLSGETIDKYLNFVAEEVNQIAEKSRCIPDVNFIKLRNILKGIGNTVEEVEKEVDELIKKYTDAMTLLYENKKIVEKGERLDNDEYIVILVDLVIRFLDLRGIHDLDERLYSLIVKTWYVAELVLEKTPYNFDIKVKLMELYERFSVTEKAMDIYKTMDIKAVQTDTLGYMFYKLHASLHLTEPIFDYLKENIKFHIESLKESKESLVACLKHDNYEKVDEFWEWDKLMQRSYFRHISFLHLAEHELHTSLRKPAASEGAVEISNLNFEYFIEQIISRYNAHLTQDPRERFTFNFDVKTPQRNTVVSAHTDNQVIAISPPDDKKVGKIHIDYLTTLNNPVMLATRAYRLDLLYSAVQPDETGKLEKLQRALQGLKGTFEKVSLDGFFDFRQFSTKTQQTSLLHVTHKDGYEYSYIKEMVEFELSNLDLEVALGNLYNFWLEVVLKKEEKDGESFIKEAESKFELVFTELEKSFDKHRQEPWRIFVTDLKKLARVLNSTLETLEIIGTGLQSLKSGVNKATKKFSDGKQFTNLYKATQTALKTFKERVEGVFGHVGGILTEISEGLKNDHAFLLKDYISDVEKLFNAEVYNIANRRKGFVTELNRSSLYLLTTFLGKLKERSKALKSLAQ